MKKILMVLSVSLVVALGLKAQPNTLYFMEDVALRHQMNPAFMPNAAWFFEVPIFPTVYFEVGNNSLTLRDFRLKRNGQWVTSYAPLQYADAYYKRFTKNNVFDTRIAFNILNGGFRFDEVNYLTFDLALKADAYMFVPKDFFRAMLYGANYTSHFDLKDFSVESYMYGELGVGYIRKLSDQWTIGAKLKGLVGFAGIHSKINRFDIYTPKNQWKLSADGEMYAMTPYVRNNVSNNTTTTGTSGDLMKPQGIGAAIDLGVTFEPIENLVISAAITDLGFISWNRTENIATISANGDYLFDEAKYKFDPNDENPIRTLFDEIATNLDKSVNLKKSQGVAESINQRITTTANFGVEYGILDNMLSFAALSNTRVNYGKIMQELTLGVNVRPADWFKAYLTHTLFNARSNTIGLGISVQAGPVNIYLASDYIPFSMVKLENANFINNNSVSADIKNIPVPYRNSRFNIQTGMVYYFDKASSDKDRDGVRNRKDKCPDTDIDMLMAKCPDKKRTEFVDKDGCTLDEDKDGVADCYDKCPNTPMNVPVDENGCPFDEDKDGVYDYLDKCPATPEGVQVDTKGCPIDSDEDGVPDYLDRCPDTPRGVQVDVDGCPVDRDGDGVTDDKDKCPGTPYGVPVDVDGCPKDSDGDGVPDYKDKCPNTPKEIIGFVDEDGCPKDTDGDGVLDYKDECPTVKGVASNKGCPEVKKEVLKVFKQALHGIQFDTGKATIKPVSFGVLNLVVDIMNNNPDYNLIIAGHTDSQGNDDYNLDLSDRRAAAVRQYLIDKGIDANRLQSKGYGETQPVATNSTAKGRAQNRRVEFTVVFEKLVKEEN